jgi:hypothetical protein
MPRSRATPRSLSILHQPPNGHLARLKVDEVGDIFVGQSGSPFVETGLDQICGLRVRVLERLLERSMPPSLQFVLGRLFKEPASVLLKSIDVPHKFSR